MKTFKRSLLALTVGVSGLGSAHAGVTINGTRVIYPASEREVSLSMVNDGKEARLLQAWVDSGNADERPETSKAPFMVTPPMARINPGKGQTLRIMYTNGQLPQDRESVFWLNVLEVPPKPKVGEASENYLQFAVRSRIKIFYRPANLPGKPSDAVNQLNWRVVKQGEGYVAECTNNTAWNVSFNDISLKGAAPNVAVSKGGMCPAKGSMTFPVTGNPDAAGNRMSLSVVNDYGSFTSHESSFTR